MAKATKAGVIDHVVAAVSADLLSRSRLGISKYGMTLDQNKGDLRYWVQHAYEESLDLCNYLKRTLMELDDGKLDPPPREKEPPPWGV